MDVQVFVCGGRSRVYTWEGCHDLERLRATVASSPIVNNGGGARVRNYKLRSGRRRWGFARASSSSAVDCSFQEFWHELPDGMRMEVVLQNGDKEQVRPPLIFIPGSAHGAWCWQENFLPYFSEKGYECYSISLRGQGRSDVRDLKFAGTIASHSEDFRHFVATIGRTPVVIAHSFAGLVVQKLASDMACTDDGQSFAGFACLCSSPPTGIVPMISRMLKKDFINTVRISWMFIRKSYQRNPGNCREVFFSPDSPEEDVYRYMEKIAAYSKIPMYNVGSIKDELPIPKPKKLDFRAFVLGTQYDAIVDRDGTLETADWFGVEPVFIDGMGHDCMLDALWLDAAQHLEQWLRGF